MPPMLGRAARRYGSCCGAPPGPDCDDRTRPKREQRHVEKQQWQREEALMVDVMRVAVDFNERDGHGYVCARLGDARRTVLVGTDVVLFNTVEGIQTEGELVRVERDTGIAAFKVNWYGLQKIAE